VQQRTDGSPSTPRHGSVLDVAGIAFEVVTSSGRAAAVRLRIVNADVEVIHHGRRCGVFGRKELMAWINELPKRPLVADDVAWSVDRWVDRNGRVAISLPDVMAWTLSPDSLTELRILLGDGPGPDLVPSVGTS
jgi:hypothetical protein